MKTLEQDKEIIANQEAGATHYRPSNTSNYDALGFELRSLDDIRENIALQERVAELEEHKLYMLEVAKSHDCDCITDLAVKCDGQERRIVELENLNKTLESLMKSGERRGVEKATEELSQTLAQKDAEIIELKAVVALALHAFDKYEMDVDSYPTIKHIKMKKRLDSVLEKRDLEQQAKGLQDYAHEELSGLSADNIHWMLTRAKGLRQQAKALENGGKPQGGEK